MLSGLRGRLVGALVLGSAVTLAVAAVLLLSPLETRLREDEVENLIHTVRSNRGSLERLAADDVHPRSEELRRAARSVKLRAGGEIIVVDSRGRVLATTDPDGMPEATRFPEGARAVGMDRSQHVVLGTGTEAVAQVAVPITIGGRRLAIVAVRRLNDARDAVLVVRHAFLVAAAISLAIALLLGLFLANRLVHRLRALRDTALRVAELGPVVEMRADRTRDEVGDLTRALVTMQDRLREQEQARRTFVATASHELRTPLSSLRVMLDLLRDDLKGASPDIADARLQAGRADDQAARLARLAADLLDLSRLDAGSPARKELMDAGELARSVISEFGGDDDGGPPPPALDCPTTAWAIGDPGAVAQIVRIMLDNATRHGPAGGAVSVAVAARDGRVTMLVSDDGPGVPEADRERIFERFERGPTAGAQAPGFGLGLPIGRELARRMGGDLTLDDQPGGTRFRLTLPAAPDAGA
jgi:signal transduction histidine kinase